MNVVGAGEHSWQREEEMQRPWDRERPEQACCLLDSVAGTEGSRKRE